MTGVWNKDSERRDKIRSDVMERLRKYRYKLAEYNACHDLYLELYPSCTQTLTDMPKIRSDTYEPERWAQRRWDQRIRLQKSLDEMSQALTDIENMVDKLTDVYRAVIVRKYLLGENMDDIRIKLNYSKRHVWNIHNNAIERLVDNE